MSFRILALVYFFALAVEIFAPLAGNAHWQFFSKPALMPLLIFYFAAQTKNAGAAKYPVIFALLFSWLGDVLLLFDKRAGSFFVVGLLAFLTAHVFYIFYFLKIRRRNRPPKLPHALVFAAIAVYTVSLFAFVAPHVENLLMPVAVYALVISTMLAASLAAFDFRRQPFGKIAVAGTLLFIVSDSILALNRFAAPFEYAPALVMLTYGTAQFLIAEASRRNLWDSSPQRHEEHKENLI